MNILTILIIAFVVLESLNVIMLYFTPKSKKGNGVGVFNAYEKAKSDPEVFAFVNYLINWVAGTKLIFIALLLVVLFFGNRETQIFSIIALIITISTFYWRLFPIIKKMDQKEQLTPKGYSRTLGIMIGLFIGIFIIGLLIQILLK